MYITRALGIGIFLIVLKFVVPRVFSGLENTLLAFFSVLEAIFAVGKDSLQGQTATPFLSIPHPMIE